VPRLPILPALELIRGFKGVLDYYYWKGIPCARKWPRIPKSHRTQASLESAHLFGTIVASWALVGAVVKELYATEAKTQPRSARDLYVSGVLGRLHEASMSDFLDLLTECRDLLQISSALTNALQSQDSDRLLTRGQDQLFSYKGTLAQARAATVSGANGYVESLSPPEGEIWCLANIAALLTERATTTHKYRFWHNSYSFMLQDIVASIAAATATNRIITLFLHHNDTIRVWFMGSQTGDTGRVDLTGYIMTPET